MNAGLALTVRPIQCESVSPDDDPRMRWDRLLRRLPLMAHARALVERWRTMYNAERPHSSLGNLSTEPLANGGRTTRRDNHD